MKNCRLTSRLTLFSTLSTLVLCLTTWGTYAAQLPLKVQPAVVNAALPDLYEVSIAELQAGLEQERFTSVDLVTVSRALTCTCSLYRTTLVNLNAIGLPRED